MIIERTINSAIVDKFKDSLGGLVIALPGQFLGVVDKILTLFVGHFGEPLVGDLPPPCLYTNLPGLGVGERMVNRN